MHTTCTAHIHGMHSMHTAHALQLRAVPRPVPGLRLWSRPRVALPSRAGNSLESAPCNRHALWHGLYMRSLPTQLLGAASAGLVFKTVLEPRDVFRKTQCSNCSCDDCSPRLQSPLSTRTTGSITVGLLSSYNNENTKPSTGIAGTRGEGSSSRVETSMGRAGGRPSPQSAGKPCARGESKWHLMF